MNNQIYASKDDSGLTCIEAIKAALTEEEYRGFLKGCVIKYVWRESRKGGARDIGKALDYVSELYLQTSMKEIDNGSQGN